MEEASKELCDVETCMNLPGHVDVAISPVIAAIDSSVSSCLLGMDCTPSLRLKLIRRFNFPIRILSPSYNKRYFGLIHLLLFLIRDTILYFLNTSIFLTLLVFYAPHLF